MEYQDLRSWLGELDKMGELKQIDGTHWDKEIGAICEMMAEGRSPALLFDNIEGYPKGFRVLGNPFLSNSRTASVLGLPLDLSKIQLVDAWRKRKKTYQPVQPIEVKEGPIKENVLTQADVDLNRFPAPIWHELDSGRYIGTGCAIVSRDLESGWINIGTYRCRVFDKDLISVGINPGKHGTMMMKKYHRRGLGFPLAIVCGMDPMLFVAACNPMPEVEESEYDIAGWIKGEPIEVTRGEYTGLPIPASAELVIEGEIPPPPETEYREDGPFGEWRRIYNSAPHPIMKVKSISYRNDPIILGVPTFKLPIPFPFNVPLMASEVWNVLENAGIPGVKGVWFGLGSVWASFMVISIKQHYAGHPKQAALAAISCKASTMGGQYVVVVDDDIDITKEIEVLCAIVNRTTMDGFDFIEKIKTGAGFAPTIRKEAKAKGLMMGGRIIIDACWPFEDLDNRMKIHGYSTQYQEEIKKKWPTLF